jgi:hypothetical protein
VAYHCVCLLGFQFISLACPLSVGQVVFHLSPLLSVFYYSSLFVIQLCRGYQYAQGLCWFMFLGVDKGVLCDAWCVVLHLFVLSIDAQTGLEPAVVVAVVTAARNSAKFSQCNME